MKAFNLFILGVFISTCCLGQYRATSCGFKNYISMDLDELSSIYLCDELDGVYTMNRNQQVLDYIDGMLDEIGLYRNFDILGCSTIDNAFATHITENATGANYRFIVYDDLLFDEITNKTNSDWGVFIVLAHELGHHLNGHIIYGGGSQPFKELQSDEFAGFALARAGGDLNAAKVAFRSIMGVEGSKTHPPLAERLVALDKGFQRGSKGFNKNIQVPQTAEQMLIANIKAVGGEDNIKKIKFMQQIKDVKYTSFNDTGSNFNSHQEVTYYKPSAYYVYSDQGDRSGAAVYMGYRIFRPDNTGFWSEDKIFGRQSMSEQANDVSYIDEYALLINNPNMKFYNQSVDSKNYYVIELPEETTINQRFNTTKTIQKIRYYDMNTHLLAFTIEKNNDSALGKSENVNYYSDYKSVGGVLFPYRKESVFSTNNKKLSSSVTSYQKIVTDIKLLPMNFIQLMRNLELTGKS